MRRVVIQCRYDEDVPKVLEIMKEFDATLVQPENPARFDHIHVDVPETTETWVDDFKQKLISEIPLIAVQVF